MRNPPLPSMGKTHHTGALRFKDDTKGWMLPRILADSRPRIGDRWAGRRDALLGAGLVASLPVAMLSTFWLLSPVSRSILPTLGLELGASAIALGLLWLPWSRLPAQWLLVCPAILAVTLASSASLDRVVVSDYVGFITVSFLYIGLTQSRLV